MPLGRLLGKGDEIVRHTDERRDHYNGSSVQSRRDDAPSTRDRVGIPHRRGAEFQNDHGPGSRPQRAISSAFNTDAPAAPRTTLWPIATSLTSKIGSGRIRPTTTVIPAPVSTWRRGCGWSGCSATT